MFTQFNIKKMIVIAILGGPIGVAMADGALDHQQTARQEVQALNVGNGGSVGQGSAGEYVSSYSGNGGQVQTLGEIGERLGGVFQGLRESL